MEKLTRNRTQGVCVVVGNNSSKQGLNLSESTREESLALTVPRFLFKSSAKELSLPISELMIRNTPASQRFGAARVRLHLWYGVRRPIVTRQHRER